MRHTIRDSRFQNFAIAAGVAMLLGCTAESRGAWSGMYGSYGPPCVVSPLDMPLTPYAMPRRPAWGGSSFAYRVKPSPQYQLCGCGWASDDTAEAARLPYPPELSESFAPPKFERLGPIPHDPLLGTAAPPSGR
jgi:hypothetical protein